jgi:hypothetical protein
MIYRFAFTLGVTLLCTACAETYHTKTNSMSESPYNTFAPPGFRPTMGIPARFPPYGLGAHTAN